MARVNLQPQPGPQTQFLASEADIAIYGGAAGGGKTFGLLLDPLRHYQNPHFGGVIFRKTGVQVKNKGGLWDESMTIYPLFRATPREHVSGWKFPCGMTMGFGHLEYEKDVLGWQGAQIPWIGFDELTHFSEYQFFYMLTRNRSVSGVKPRIRAACNPDPDSWVKKFILWWLDAEGEYPDPAKSGKLRWFIRLNDEMIWRDTKAEIHAEFGHGPHIQPKSVTFIPSKLEDNKILMEKDPSYLGNLLAQDRVTRMRLHQGNWKVKPAAGMYFQRGDFEIIDVKPHSPMTQARYWDKAATKPSESNKDPDYTAGLKMSKYASGLYIVEHVVRLRDSPLAVERLIKNTALQDGPSIPICVEQEPGSAGVADADNYVRLLGGYNVRIRKPTKDKLTRALPVSAQSEHGNIKLLRGPWNDDFLAELENFSGDGKGHDDQVDCFSGAFNELSGNLSVFDLMRKS